MNYQKGFIVPLLLIIIAILVVGGGAYVFTQNKQENPPAVGNTTSPLETSTAPATNQTTQTIQAKTYTDAQYRFAFSYPSDFALSSPLTPAPSSYSIDCMNPSLNNRVCLYYMGGQTSDGFEAADLELNVNTSTTKKDCEKPLQSPVAGKGPTTQPKVINGITFYYDLTGGAATGHYLSTNQYRTYKNGACYTIALNIGSNIGQSEKGLSNEFSNMMLAKLQSILSTFKFNP